MSIAVEYWEGQAELLAPAELTDKERRVLGAWTERYELTSAEQALIPLALNNIEYKPIATARGVAVQTIKNQSRTLRIKVGCDNFTAVLVKFLREVAALP